MSRGQKGFTSYNSQVKTGYQRVPAADAASSHEPSMTKSFPRSYSGFTLIEILLVIAIIAILATVVVVALDPVKRFQDARDARRLSDIQSILSAVQQYIIDNKGALPSGLDTIERQIGTARGSCLLWASHCHVDEDTCLDLSTPLAKYLKSMPYDPAYGSDSMTHYSISVNENNIVTVSSCDSTDATIASVSR